MIAHHGRVDADERYPRRPVVDDERSGELPQMDALSDLIHFAVSQLQNRTRCMWSANTKPRSRREVVFVAGFHYSEGVPGGKPRDRIETGFLPESVAVI